MATRLAEMPFVPAVLGKNIKNAAVKRHEAAGGRSVAAPAIGAAWCLLAVELFRRIRLSSICLSSSMPEITISGSGVSSSGLEFLVIVHLVEDMFYTVDSGHFLIV